MSEPMNRDHPGTPPREAATLQERADHIVDALPEPFTIDAFVASSKRAGIEDYRDISCMLRHVVKTERIVPMVAASFDRAGGWTRRIA